ncbi:MAG: F0F1 ATP synthase subunit A [Bacteroidetes bacterium]|nr:F0F1 ATP synthase subunit A [Bacteroidota bacterium]MBI3481585.1 F0F1 ATP synthase subunit A [Bacteroidota bacterium]
MRKPFFTAIPAILTLFFVAAFGFPCWAQESEGNHSDTTDTTHVQSHSDSTSAESHGEEHGKFNPNETIIEHVKDAPIWHFADHVVLPLPVIVYSSQKGLDVFSSSHFYDENHKEVEYNGYKLEGRNIILTSTGEEVLNLSITKNVAMLFITAAVLLSVLLSVAGSYKKNQGKAPKGLQSFMEPIIVFVRDEIVKPNIGHHYEKYLPYILTLFFFILFGNLLGLLPGAANLTGNIAVTFTLAILTFMITNFSGNASYWKHIFWTPGVPLPLRIIILPVEIIGIFTKPFALTIRLFVAITAGHIVILSLICLGFIFHSYIVGFGASLVVVFINLIELLVAGIQAYVFALFTSLYIGMSTAEDEHH